MIEVIDQYGTRHRFDDNHCIHSESKHQVQVGLQNGDEYEVVATFPYPAMYGRVTEMDCLSLREAPAGVVRQLNKLEAENARLREDLAKERERAETRGLALDAAVSSSCVLGAELAAAQAVIAQMREALTEVVDADECQDADGWLCFELSAEAYHRADAALSIQCNQDALHEALAKECERLAKAHGVGVMKWLCEEAAAHRARKENSHE